MPFRLQTRARRSSCSTWIWSTPISRLTDRSGLIKSKEIRLVSPNFVHSSVETLSLPAEVASAFALDWDTVIFDVGGDPAGATALGRYREDFDALPEGSLTVLNVVNTRRPMAGTPEKLIHLMEGMERHSRQKVTGFVNNTNLARMANADDLRDGYEVVREASERSGVPVLYTTGRPDLLEQFLAEGHDPKFIGAPMPIQTYMHRDWETFTREGL